MGRAGTKIEIAIEIGIGIETVGDVGHGGLPLDLKPSPVCRGGPAGPPVLGKHAGLPLHDETSEVSKKFENLGGLMRTED